MESAPGALVRATHKYQQHECKVYFKEYKVL